VVISVDKFLSVHAVSGENTPSHLTPIVKASVQLFDPREMYDSTRCAAFSIIMAHAKGSESKKGKVPVLNQLSYTMKTYGSVDV
jgi:hypothetical protein